jgi:hypothetical protein
VVGRGRTWKRSEDLGIILHTGGKEMGTKMLIGAPIRSTSRVIGEPMGLILPCIVE